MRRWLFTRLDWLIAWRHLRTGDELPVWVRPLVVGSIYLIVVGLALAGYASHLDGVGPELEGTAADLGPTPLQQYYGAFGGLTLIVGVMALTFGLLAWFFNLLPTIITMSVLLGCMALVVVLSLMSGLEGDLRDKILHQKAHIRVSRSDARPFSDYESLTAALAEAEGVAGASPYLEGEIMVRSGLNRQGAVLAGIVPARHTEVSNLHTLVESGDYGYLSRPEAIPDPDPFGFDEDETPWRLRHLEDVRKKTRKQQPEPSDVLRPGDPVEKLPGTGAPPREVGPSEDDGAGPSADLEPSFDGDEGWEDPVVELGRPDEGVSEADEDDDEPPDDGAEGGHGLLSRLPPPPTLGTDPGAQAPEDDGWEDPARLIPELREQGIVPPAEADEEAPEQAPTAADSETVDEEPHAGEPVLDPILIGRELAMELGVRVGAQVQLITPIGRTTPAGQIPGVRAARIAGVFYSGMYEYDRKNVYAPLPEVQRFLLTGDRVSGIEVKLEDIDEIDRGKAAVERVVAEQGRADELLVEDWRDLNRNLFSAMFLEKVAMFIALLFVVLVASFGILASNLMSVMEKSKEIAILKAMGTGDDGILRVFIAEGLCVGFLGSFGGIAMGLVLCWALDRYGLPLNENVYYIERLPVVVNPVEVVLVGVAALVIVCISSLYPALVASRMRPVDALRHADQ